jgi:hypothetical protein
MLEECPEERECIKCQKVKLITEFYFCGGGFYRNRKCKKCVNEVSSENKGWRKVNSKKYGGKSYLQFYYEKNKEKIRAKSKKFREDNPNFCHENYLKNRPKILIAQAKYREKMRALKRKSKNGS